MSEIQTTAFDETAASNNSASPNGFPEGMAPSGVNDSARELMAQIKRWQNRLQGRADAGTLISSAGSVATFTVDYDTAPASLYTGLVVCFKANATFGANSTLNVNSLGAKNIQKITTGGYTNIGAADIMITQHVWVKFDGTLDKWVLMSQLPPDTSAFVDPMTTRGDIITRGASAAQRLAVGSAGALLMSDGTDPAWVTTITGVKTFTSAPVITVTTDGTALQMISTEAGASLGPELEFYRNSASAANGDAIGAFRFAGNDDGGTKTNYGAVLCAIDTATDGASEASHLSFQTRQANSHATRFNIGAGLYANGVSGGDKGAGTGNFEAVYDGGVLLTDYVFDQAVDGVVDLSKYAPIAGDFEAGMLDIDWLSAYWREHRHFPNIPGQETWSEESRPSVGQLAQALLEIVEVQAVHIASLNERLKLLESKCASAFG